jgi:[ribosomal protein S5]-alanine N-acetyltransferase
MTAAPAFRLVPLLPDGTPGEFLPDLPPAIVGAGEQTAALFATRGYRPPWIGYLAVVDGAAVGGGAFVGPPQDGVVEIAYFTLPECEGRGIAGRTAAALVGIARAVPNPPIVSANTLAREGASTAILSRLGFVRAGTRIDEDAGEVWHWRLP